MLSLITFIAVVGLFISLRSLSVRVRDLEQKLSGAQRPLAPASPAVPSTDALQPTSVPAPATPLLTAGPSSGDRFVEWLKENWLLKLGALLLLIGFGWLVSYAFLNNWIGPAGRITFGLVGGAGILALGFWRMRAYVTQGAVFTVLGASVILLTTYAARSMYGFFDPFSALILMFATSALVALASGIYNRKSLALASIALAGIAPLLTHSPAPDYIGLFAYLMVVILGAVWIVAWKDFREVVVLALVIVAVYSAPALVGFQSADLPVLLLFAYGFAAIFYIVHTAGLFRLKGSAAASDMIVASGNALLLLTWVYVAAVADWRSLLLAAWAAAFVIGGYLVFYMSGRREPLYLYAAIAVGYIAAATALELDGAALTIAYTFESAAVSLALFGITRDVKAALRATLLLIGPVALSIGSIVSNAWKTSLFNEHFFVLAILAAVFFILGGVYWGAARSTGSKDTIVANAVLQIAGSLYAYVLLWLSLHFIFQQTPDVGVMIALIVYTIIGITAYVLGGAEDSSGLRAYGGALLLFVVARLLIVDVWQMALSGRIITFFLIGALLMSTAFLRRKKTVIHENIQA